MPKFVSLIPYFKKNAYLLLAALLLFCASYIIDYFQSGSANVNAIENEFTAYLQKAQKDFEALNSNSEFINSVFDDELPTRGIETLAHKNYFAFFYNLNTTDSSELVLWNTQTILPTKEILTATETSGFTQLSNGYYVWFKQFNNRGFAIGLLPIKWNYIVTNEYLKNDFVLGNGLSYEYKLTPAGNVKDLNGKALFGLEEIHGVNVSQNNALSILLKLLGSFVIFIFIYFLAMYLLQAGFRPTKVFIYFFLLLIFLRLLSYFFPIPLNFRQFQLFNPVIYGSGPVLKSLGDLLINVILALGYILFVRVQMQKFNFKFYIKNNTTRWIVLVAYVFALLSITYISSLIIRSLIADSSISFDVINFFSLNIHSIIGFVILGSIGIIYFLLCQIIWFNIKANFKFPLVFLYLLISCFGLLILTTGWVPMNSGFELWLLAWLLVFVFIFDYNKVNLIASRFVVSKLIFWIFFFSVSISLIILTENNKKEIRERKHFAEILAHKSDPTNETLLNSMLIDFNPNFLFNHFKELADPVKSLPFRDSLINNNFSGYTNKYDTKVLVFDEKEQPLFNRDSFDYNKLNTIYTTQAKATGISYLYYYDQAYDKFSYISKRSIFNLADSVMGYVFVLVTPKSSEGQTLYPELFSRGQNNALEKASNYAFAVYNNNYLVNRHNDYGFTTKIDSAALGQNIFLSKVINNYNELWYNAGNGKIVVIVKENKYFIEAITLFSYLFCAFLLLAALFWFINILLRSRFNLKRLNFFLQLTIRNQIHGTVIFFSILSFVVIGIATILFFINKYESNNREKLSTTIQIMEKEITTAMKSGWLLSDSLTIVNTVEPSSAENMIQKISEIHGVDINIYNKEGNLKLSSLALPYLKGIVSTKMDPGAFCHLSREKSVQFFQKEKIGELNFLSNYSPVLDSAGNNYAYLNIPYFTSQSKLKQEISNFLITIINLNAFIFLIAGMVAYFITNRITNSFSVIAEKMKNLNIGQYNQTIVWKRKDEIGKLVSEYNKMVIKLEESAQALAKSEREGAWQEMARQVAHEIKNPLTPMKLSMQFLQRAIQTKAPNIEQLTNDMTKTLIEQIDHLSNIASEFSQFANIESNELEKVNLTAELQQLRNLYAGHYDTNFTWDIPEQPTYFMGDTTQINRLFTNLIQNALQSVPEDEMASIKIIAKSSGKFIIVSVEDNGAGIPEALHEKIFTPNFTTKTSGTGLGLAMCKRIVEKSNGKIYFETGLQKGTKFFVELPLIA